MIPSSAEVKSAFFVVGRCYCVGALPSETIIVGYIGVASFRGYTAVSSHHYSLAVGDKYRWLNHYRLAVANLDYSSIPVDAAFGADAVHSHVAHVHKPDILVTNGAHAVGKHHIAMVIHSFPG